MDIAFGKNPDSQALWSPHPPVRVKISTGRPEALARLSEPLRSAGSIEVLSCDENASQAAVLPGELPADVVLVECPALAPQNSLELRQTAHLHRPARVLWLLSEPPTSKHSMRMVLDAVKDGWCHGYIADDCPLATLVRSIRAVARNDLWMPRTMLVHALSRAEAPRAGTKRADSAAHGSNKIRLLLTKRERHILRLVRLGLTNKEVARQLAIREDTVKKHLRNVYAKLGIHRRMQLVLGSVGVTPTPA